ncbi:MAG: hypothetical protein SGPRY_000986, partial [Prymnesium sp.]
MLRQRNVPPATSEDSPSPTPLSQVMSLGCLYGPLNLIPPLSRLYAISALLLGLPSARGGLLFPMLASLSSQRAAITLAPVLARRLLPDEQSSAHHHARLLATELARASLQLLLCLLSLPRLDAHACGLEGGAMEVAAGAALACCFCLMWSFAPVALGVEPREGLVMGGGTHDLSGASADELLRTMRPATHATHLLARCLCVMLDAFADVLLFFIFLACATHGISPPSSRLYVESFSPAALLAAFAYGSQASLPTTPPFRPRALAFDASGLPPLPTAPALAGGMAARDSVWPRSARALPYLRRKHGR